MKRQPKVKKPAATPTTSPAAVAEKPKKPASKPTATNKTKRQKLLSNILHITLFMIWVFLSLVVSQVVVGTVLFLALGDNLYNNPLWMTVYTALSYGLSCLFVLFLPNKFKKLNFKTSREELGLSGWPKWRDIVLAICGFFVYFVLAALLISLVSWIFPGFDAAESQSLGYSNLYDTTSRILAFIGLIIIAPIAEELIFRGWLYGKLRRHSVIWVSVLLTSLLFAFAHSPISAAINVFAMSVVMCLMRELTGTIYGSVILHILKNAVAVWLLLYSGML